MQDGKKTKLLGAADFVVGETYTSAGLLPNPFVVLWKDDKHTLVHFLKEVKPTLYTNTSFSNIYAKYSEEKKITKWMNIYRDGSAVGGYPSKEAAQKYWLYDKKNLVACIEVTASYHEGDGIND